MGWKEYQTPTSIEHFEVFEASAGNTIEEGAAGQNLLTSFATLMVGAAPGVIARFWVISRLGDPICSHNLRSHPICKNMEYA